MVLIWLIKVVLYNLFYFFYLSEEEKNEKRECGKNRYRRKSVNIIMNKIIVIAFLIEI